MGFFIILSSYIQFFALIGSSWKQSSWACAFEDCLTKPNQLSCRPTNSPQLITSQFVQYVHSVSDISWDFTCQTRFLGLESIAVVIKLLSDKKWTNLERIKCKWHDTTYFKICWCNSTYSLNCTDTKCHNAMSLFMF